MRATKKRRGGLDERSNDENIAVTPATWNYIKDFFAGEASTQGNARTLQKQKRNDNSLGDMTNDSSTT